MRPLIVLVLVLLCAPARAGRHTVERGETLEHVAQVYGCSLEAVLRANGLRTTLVPPGTVVVIPSCTVRTRARTREPDRRRNRPRPDDRAQRALAVIDGTAVIASPREGTPADRSERDAPPRSGGLPWKGWLRGAARLPPDDGYLIRRPHRAFGAPHVIEHLRGTIATVRALYPDVHTLAIGDLSARHGGKIAEHQSHQSGLDVDVGFYFHAVPDGYPASFVAANADLDLEATWALITGFARTAHLETGVKVIFLDRAVQARLYRWARKRGTPHDHLAYLLQYPRRKDALAGLVRHWPNHADHLHVRFKPAR